MNIEDVEDYNKNVNIIKSLVNKTYKNYNIKFIKNIETNLIEINIFDFKITILQNDKWNKIKKHIEHKLNGFSGECSICLNKIIKNVSCNNCLNNWCGDCYINLFKNGKGIIICPYCRFSFGENIQDDNIINLCIDDIRKKLIK
jgi:hypothetical protein